MSIGINASQAFSPNKIDGLSLWLDASDVGTIIEVGGFVSQWSDKSGNGNHATQTTGSQQPATGANTINGLNAITYDGMNDALIIAPSSSIDDLFIGGASVFVAANPLTRGGSNVARIFDKGNTTVNFIRDISGGSTGIGAQAGFSTTTGFFRTATRDIVLGVGNVFGTLYDTSLSTNIPGYRVNEVVIATEIQTVPSGTPLSDAGLDLFIGNRVNLNRTWDGYFGEVLLYDHILTAGEIADLENYLIAKWSEI